MPSLVRLHRNKCDITLQRELSLISELAKKEAAHTDPK